MHSAPFCQSMGYMRLCLVLQERHCVVRFITLLCLAQISEHLHPDIDEVLDDKARSVNIVHLVTQFSLICPINKYCKQNTSNKVGFNATDIPVPNDCISCSCDFSCIKDGTCCPDAAVAYEKMECIDVQLMVNEVINLEATYFLKASCQNFIGVEPVLIQKCEKPDSLIQPHYSYKTKMNYKNEFCAQCNGEDMASLTAWELVVKCLSKRIVSIHDIMHSCTFVYSPIWFQRAVKCDKVDERQSYAFDRCNMTGLWTSFDQDIEFGCENFHQPYGKFKNVFCYICNPSLLSTKAKALKTIDHCESQASIDESYLQNLENLCEERGTLDRLHPFKNIYCKMCSLHYSILIDDKKSININMITDPPTDPTQIDLEVTLPKGYNTKEALGNIMHLLSQIYNPSGVFSSITTEPETDAPPKNITSLIKHYSTMCGYTNICNLSYIDNLPDGIIPDYRACPACDCSDECVFSRLPCCIDKVLERNMYSCTKQSSFLKIELTFQVGTSNSFVNSDGDQGDSFVTVSTCPTNADPVIIDKCKGSLINDYIEKIPIVVKKSSTAMKNIFCLECHNYTVDKISVYIKFRCISYFEGFLFTSLEEIFEAAKEMDCDIAFTLSEDQKCENQAGMKEEDGMVSKCNVTGLWETENHDVRQACEQTDQSRIMNQNLRPYAMRKSLYKNAFCAFCNEQFGMLSDYITDDIMCVDGVGDKVKQLCYTMHSDPWWGTYSNVFCYHCETNMAEYKANVSHIEFPLHVGSGTNKAFLYRSLFSIKREELEVMKTEVQHPCSGGAFDHEKGICVNFFCAPGRIIQDGKCIHIFKEASDLSYSLMFSLQLAENKSIERRELEFRPYFLCMAIFDNIRYRLHNVGIGSPSIPYCYVNTNSCESQSLNLSSNEEFSKDALWTIPNNTFVNIQMNLFETQTSDLTLYEDTLIDTFDEEFIVNDTRFFKYVNFGSVGWATGCTQRYEFISAQALRQQTLELKRVHRCLMVDRLVKDDLVFDNVNDILLIHNSSIKISTTDFEMYEKDRQVHARICYNALPLGFDTDLHQQSLTNLQKSTMDHAYIVFSSTCTGLSMLGLLMTFITYCLFKGLRTVPGKNNMHLSLCLLVAQASLQYSLNLSSLDDSLQCKVTGILIHYFWLATFCAMNVCSFHMYQVFFARSMRVNPTPQQKFRRALKYALYIYSAPFFTVLVVVLGHILQSDFQNIGYGVSACFIDEFYVLIFSFIAPTGIITAVNMVFYCLTFYRLRVAPTVRSTSQNRQDLIIYAKLCSITGIMWPLVFVDALLELSVFSFLATFANAFQGVFMFLSFVCNRRVFGMYKALVGRDQDSSVLSLPNSTRNTDKSVKSTSDRPASSLSCSDIQDRTVSSLPCSDVQDGIVLSLPCSDIQDVADPQ